jgi:prepilin-type N-terminal cleavage/methylation domain-containing protein
MRYSKQKGFTLIELVFVLVIIGMMMILEMQQKTLEIEQGRARNLGVQIYRYANGVQEWMATNAGRMEEMTVNGEFGPRSGVDWLKGPLCDNSKGTNGISLINHVPCEFLEGPTSSASDNGLMNYGHLSFVTDVVDLGGGVMQSTTVFDELSFEGMRANSMSGLAAMVASGTESVRKNSLALLTSDSNIRYCITEGPTECIGNEGRIIIVSTNVSENDRWLRTDHGNKMKNAIEFDANVTDVDTFGYGFSLRQIKNVARIYNEGIDTNDDGIPDVSAAHPDNDGDGLPDDALFLGKDMHVVPPTLLSAGVIVDADQVILGKLNVIGNIETQGGNMISRAGVDINGVFGGGDIEAYAGTDASGNSGGNINAIAVAGDDATSGGDLNAVSAKDAGGNWLNGGDVNADDDLNAGDDLKVGNHADIGNGQGGDLRVRSYDDSGNNYGQGGNAFIDSDLLVGHLNSGGTIHSRMQGSGYNRGLLQPGDIRADNDALIGNNAIIENDLRVENNATIIGWIASERSDRFIQTTGMIDIDDPVYYTDPNQLSNFKKLSTEEIEGTGANNTLSLEGDTINFRKINGASNNSNAVNLRGYVDTSELQVKVGSGFVPLESMLPKFVHQSTFSAGDGDRVEAPACAVGGTPKIILVPQSLEMTVETPSPSHWNNGGASGWYTRAVASGSGWIVEAKDAVGSRNTQNSVLAQTFCSY